MRMVQVGVSAALLCAALSCSMPRASISTAYDAQNRCDPFIDIEAPRLLQPSSPEQVITIMNLSRCGSYGVGFIFKDGNGRNISISPHDLSFSIELRDKDNKVLLPMTPIVLKEQAPGSVPHYYAAYLDEPNDAHVLFLYGNVSQLYKMRINLVHSELKAKRCLLYLGALVITL